MSLVIETTRTPKQVTISFPADEIGLAETDRIVSLLKVAIIASKSRMTAAEAEEISEEIKASWWSNNKERILKMIEDNG